MVQLTAVIRARDFAAIRDELEWLDVQCLCVRSLREDPLRWSDGRWSTTRSGAVARALLEFEISVHRVGTVTRVLLPFVESFRLGFSAPALEQSFQSQVSEASHRELVNA